MDKEIALRISADAARHHGVFTRAMALKAGASESMIDRRIRKGEWQRPYSGVYVMAGTPATWERAVVASVFGAGPGAAASHRTAVHLWGLCDRPKIIEVTSPLKGRPEREHVIHRSTDLSASDVREVAGIPMTTVTRSLVAVGVPWGQGLASRALDEALRRQLTDLTAIASQLHRVARRGRRGAGVMRSILEDRLGWSGITQSQLEDEYLRIMRLAGLTLPESQVRILRKGGRIIARVDFVYPKIRLIVELDGERYHTGRDTSVTTGVAKTN
jgi:very-short-patch-repair endonuclease